MTTTALLDSNVIIAALAEAHEHHEASTALFSRGRNDQLAVAAHSYAEAFGVLTRKGGNAPFAFGPQDAWSALESIRAMTTLVGLTPAQTFDAVRAYARTGGIGARLYDKLIGEAAVMNAIPTIVTWNRRHMRSLFPDFEVLTPAEFSPAS